MRFPIIAITMGDPGGIGPEIITKTFSDTKLNSSFRYVIFGARTVFEDQNKKRRPSLSYHFISEIIPADLEPGKVYFYDASSRASQLNIGSKNKNLRYVKGKVSRSNATLAFAALEAAADHAIKGLVNAVVTAPINKTAMRMIDPAFKGHTEYLAKKASSEKFAMMFVSNQLKVTLVTIHVALKDVSRLIRKEEVFQKIKLTYDFLQNYFKIKKPRLGICALNPHGKETGREDEKEIRPAVLKARNNGVDAIGPLSADQLFYEAYQGRFDAVVSMYHDQGLCPFKMIAFRDGVNVTLGLPFIRTSPDHGTAFDIAGKGIADPVSFQSAMRLAEKLARPTKR